MAKGPSLAYRQAVTFALRAFTAHPQATLVDGPTYDARGAVAAIAFDLQFGGRWLALGQSPTGVEPVEMVELRFPPDFPLSAPIPSLRSNFSRNHPHIQPWLTPSGRVVPCLIDGRLSEFIVASGFDGLADQTYAWLTSAAEGRLIDSGRGWEPARRDEISNFLAIDEDQLRSLVDDDGGFQFFESRYICEWNKAQIGSLFYGELGPRATVQLEVKEGVSAAGSRYASGTALVVAIWPERNAESEPTVSSDYQPDDIATVEQLRVRAATYGLKGPLDRAMALIKSASASKKGDDFPVVILMLVRRPRDLIGADSPIEIMGYITPRHMPGGALQVETDPVSSVGLRASLSKPLLMRMGGAPALPKWVLLGAGSLGSKIALHLGRQGSGPALVADTGVLAPHNAARHGLYPPGRGLGSGWTIGKSQALVSVLAGLAGDSVAVQGDHLALNEAVKTMRGKSRPAWLLNATASLAARETLAGPDFRKAPRQIEVSLYDGGQLGVMAIEGDMRNPNTLELICDLYQQTADDPVTGDRLFSSEGVGRIETGQGCGSLTTVMTDARISTMAAMFAEAFTALPSMADGRIRLFERQDDLGVQVKETVAPPRLRVPVEGMPGWTLSLPQAVVAEIEAETARHPGTETGGVLVGRISSPAKTIVVTALEPAPSDSERRPTLFVLGTEGLGEAIAERRRRSKGLLDAVGTWHSHLGSARPSQTDHATAARIALPASQPISLLIIGTDGFRAVAAPPTETEA